MLVKLFGLLDVIAGITLIYLSYASHTNLATFFIVYLILKGLLFFGGLVSLIDIAAGVFIGLASIGNFYLLSWFFVIWLIQKGLISLLI